MKKIYTNFLTPVKNIILLALLFCAIHSVAQVQDLSLRPLSEATTLTEKTPFLDMPAVDAKRLQNEDIERDQYKEFPWRFGENISVNIGIENAGVWSRNSDGQRIWRVGIASEDAFHLNFSFDQFRLPKGGRLFVYDETHTQILGAFTEQNNQADGHFGTTLIKGSRIIIEYDEPLNAAFAAQLHLNRVTHGYRDAFAKTADAFGSSGSCNNNVNCPIGVDWACTKKSVCMLVTGGNGFCTGTLVNNTAQDNAPYVMTANHCYSDPSTWVFWFNWESATCTNPAAAPAYNAVSGATLKARRTDPDFCLVRINAAIPSNYDVVYAGWDHSGITPRRAVGIHHPSGDIKKISFADSVSVGATGPVTGTNGWRTWWGSGVTEPGSSGSALFDENQRFIGQLYGGPSSCAATGANRTDYYGKVSVSWEGTDNTQRLKDWLDPTSSNVLTLDAAGCNGFSISTTTNDGSVCRTGVINNTLTARASGTFVGAVALTSSGVPTGVTVAFGTTPLSPVTGTPRTSSVTITVTTAAAAGVYPITITGTSGTVVKTITYNLTIENTPVVPALLIPAAGATGVATIPTLTWAVAAGAVTYDFELALDSTQAARVATQSGIAARTYTLANPLTISTNYFWRVRSVNSCGVSVWSAWRVFTTNNCPTFVSTDVPKAISAVGANVIVNSTLTISAAQAANIASVSVVNIAGTHTYIGDLDFALLNPAGTVVTLKARSCGGATDFSFSFDDAAALAVIPCTPSPVGTGGTYRPATVLTVLNGTNSAGIWTLRVRDLATGDGGSLNSWGLRVCPVPGAAMAPIAGNLTACRASGASQAFNITLNATGAYAGTDTLSVSGLPTGVTAAFGNIYLRPTATLAANTTLTLSVNAAAVAGTYTVTVTAKDGATSTSQNITVTIQDAPSVITLNTPANLSTTVPTTGAVFTWAAAATATNYQWQLSNDSTFTSLVADVSNNAPTSITASGTLEVGTVYWWRVRAVNDCGASAWSSVRIFQTAGDNLRDIPLEVGTYVGSTQVVEVSTGWSHFIKKALVAPISRRDLLILSVKIPPNSGTIGTPQIVVTATNGSIRPTFAGRYIQDSAKWYVIQRAFQILPSPILPTYPNAPIRFYYPTTDYDGLRSNVPSLTTHQGMTFFNFKDGVVNPNPAFGHAGGTLQNFEVMNSTYGTWQTHHYGEFTVNLRAAGGGAGAGSVPIFLEGLLFNGKRVNGANELYWQTAQERNVSHFILEHSRNNGTTYREIARVNAVGNSTTQQNYKFVDGKSIAAIHTYRLRAVSTTGGVAFAPNLVIIATPEDAVKLVKFFPNPTTKIVNIGAIGDNETVTVRVFNDLGQLMKEATFNSNDYLQLSLEGFANGSYMLRIDSPSVSKAVQVVKAE
jgi:subtilisin-like proprotein convertase family protein